MSEIPSFVPEQTVIPERKTPDELLASLDRAKSRSDELYNLHGVIKKEFEIFGPIFIPDEQTEVHAEIWTLREEGDRLTQEILGSNPSEETLKELSKKRPFFSQDREIFSAREDAREIVKKAGGTEHLTPRHLLRLAALNYGVAMSVVGLSREQKDAVDKFYRFAEDEIRMGVLWNKEPFTLMSLAEKVRVVFSKELDPWIQAPIEMEN